MLLLTAILFHLFQNIHFDDFKTTIIEEDEEKEEHGEEEEQVDTSPWAGSDRDYSYEEVGFAGVWFSGDAVFRGCGHKNKDCLKWF